MSEWQVVLNYGGFSLLSSESLLCKNHLELSGKTKLSVYENGASPESSTCQGNRGKKTLGNYPDFRKKYRHVV